MINDKQNSLFLVGKHCSSYKPCRFPLRNGTVVVIQRKKCCTGQEIGSLELTAMGSALIILRNGLSLHRLDG